MTMIMNVSTINNKNKGPLDLTAATGTKMTTKFLLLKSSPTTRIIQLRFGSSTVFKTYCVEKGYYQICKL